MFMCKHNFCIKRPSFSTAYTSYRDSRYKLEDTKSYFLANTFDRWKADAPVLSSELNGALLRIIDLESQTHFISIREVVGPYAACTVADQDILPLIGIIYYKV